MAWPRLPWSRQQTVVVERPERPKRPKKPRETRASPEERRRKKLERQRRQAPTQTTYQRPWRFRDPFPGEGSAQVLTGITAQQQKLYDRHRGLLWTDGELLDLGCGDYQQGLRRGSGRKPKVMHQAVDRGLDALVGHVKTARGRIGSIDGVVLLPEAYHTASVAELETADKLLRATRDVHGALARARVWKGKQTPYKAPFARATGTIRDARAALDSAYARWRRARKREKALHTEQLQVNTLKQDVAALRSAYHDLSEYLARDDGFKLRDLQRRFRARDITGLLETLEERETVLRSRVAPLSTLYDKTGEALATERGRHTRGEVYLLTGADLGELGALHRQATTFLEQFDSVLRHGRDPMVEGGLIPRTEYPDVLEAVRAVRDLDEFLRVAPGYTRELRGVIDQLEDLEFEVPDAANREQFRELAPRTGELLAALQPYDTMHSRYRERTDRDAPPEDEVARTYRRACERVRILTDEVLSMELGTRPQLQYELGRVERVLEQVDAARDFTIPDVVTAEQVVDPGVYDRATARRTELQGYVAAEDALDVIDRAEDAYVRGLDRVRRGFSHGAFTGDNVARLGRLREAYVAAGARAPHLATLAAFSGLVDSYGEDTIADAEAEVQSAYTGACARLRERAEQIQGMGALHAWERVEETRDRITDLLANVDAARGYAFVEPEEVIGEDLYEALQGCGDVFPIHEPFP